MSSNAFETSAVFPDRLSLAVSRGDWFVVDPIVSPRVAAVVIISQSGITGGPRSYPIG